MSAVLEPTSAEARNAAARSRAFQLLQQAVAYPDDDYCAAIRAGDLAKALRDCLVQVAPTLAEDNARWEALSECGVGDELAVEYTRLFDVGTSGPPCALYGGLYGDTRMKTMEEAVRFYNHFGLGLSEEQRELPDHIATQLEFLHYLAYREAEALEADSDPGPYRRAQRDFIARHPGSWIPKLCERLRSQTPAPFFSALYGCLEELLSHEQIRLADAQ